MARKKRGSIYFVRFMKPGDTAETDLGYFALVDNHFGYVGELVSLWP